ncbi:MAG: acyltransferase [Actinomycetota bacterium]|nr:acyltransferase [Actinomycetota bacterium]
METSRPRIEWMDLVKGTAVLVVVLFHSVNHMESITKDDSVSAVWFTSMNVLEPMRMPLFFMVSGMLAAGAISRPWRRSRRRTYGMTYLYILWSAIFFTVVALYVNSGFVAAISQFPGRLLVGSSGYWYLYALLLYFIVAKLLCRYPAWIIVALAIGLNLLRAPVAQWNRDFMVNLDAGSAMTSIVTNLVFFLIGAYYKELLAQITRWASWLWVAGLLVPAIAYGIWRSANSSTWELTYLPVSLLWIVAGAMAAYLLVQWEAPRKFGTFFGARTLPIFVVQFPLLMCLSSYLHNNNPAYMQNAIVQVFFPVAMTSMLVGAALILYWVTRNNFGKYLFEAPGWVVREPRALKQEHALLESNSDNAQDLSNVHP